MKYEDEHFTIGVILYSSNNQQLVRHFINKHCKSKVGTYVAGQLYYTRYLRLKLKGVGDLLDFDSIL